MIVLGLTGSIGMGKSEAAKAFRRLGVPVFDADAEVHGLLGPGGRAVAAVEAAFPGVVAQGAVDRPALGGRVFADRAQLDRLEAILHPLVRLAQHRFMSRARAAAAKLVVNDVPLLYETGGERRCDYVAVVSAPACVQRQRVLARPDMSEEKFAAILALQTPDREKRRRADFVIPSGAGKRVSLGHIRAIVAALSPAPRTAPGKPRRRVGRRALAGAKRPG